jgi:acyl carrier protein
MGLDSVEIVMEAERLFNIELPDSKVEKILTFGEFTDCVFEACVALGRNVEHQDVANTLRNMISEHLSISKQEIRPESRLVDDLGMN